MLYTYLALQSYHNDLVSFVTATPAEGYLDSTLATMIAMKLLRIGKRDHVSLNVGLLELANADVIVAVIVNDLDLVFVVAHGQVDCGSLLRRWGR